MLHINNNAKHSEVMKGRRERRTIVLVEVTHGILQAHLICQDTTIVDREKVNDAQDSCSVIKYSF